MVSMIFLERHKRHKQHKRDAISRELYTQDILQDPVSLKRSEKHVFFYLNSFVYVLDAA